MTIPLEITLAGMPGLQYTRSESLFELSHIRNQFNYGVDPLAARQEVINRLQFTQLPNGATPQISPELPTGEILRYTLRNPKDASGKPIYSLNDLKSLEDYTLERLYSSTAAHYRTRRALAEPSSDTKSIPIRATSAFPIEPAAPLVTPRPTLSYRHAAKYCRNQI